MDRFMQQHQTDVNGSLSGWDRVAFRGTIRLLANKFGLLSYMRQCNVLLKDFKHWAPVFTRRIRAAGEEMADKLGIYREYLRSCRRDKEALARQVAQDRGIKEGPICMLSVVEPSYAPEVRGNKSDQKLHLDMVPRPCVWQYFYFNDPELGFGHVRLASWLPFTIKGCLNGRHWLERSLIKHGIDYVKQDNCFRWVEDVGRAQQLLDEQLRTEWPALWESMIDRYFPVMRTLFGQETMHYYWSADESEWATDIMFKDTARLDRLYPMLARHALLVSDSSEVMRFLGRIDSTDQLPANLKRDIRSDRRRRYEGLCAKHRVGRNSIKSYNKAGNVLRVETTINQTRDFKVFRQPDDDRERKACWLPMRKGVADMHRRAHISQRSNERYFDALGACESDATLLEEIGQLCKRSTRNGRSLRALNPYNATDFQLLKFLAQANWNLNGFRNRDLARFIDPAADQLPPEQRRKLTSRVSRLLALLKTHGLIEKVNKTHRYQVTRKGTEVTALVVLASNVQTKEFMKMAA